VPASLPPARLAVLERIRRGDKTVNAVAASLGVTDNAVRAHLVALEQAGLIARRGLVRSGSAGQPAAEYDVTSRGEARLSAAYPGALAALVAALTTRFERRALRSVFLDAGRRLADEFPSRATGSLATRAHACAELIESLGGAVTVETGRGEATVRGHGCPLADAVRAEPATCALIEGLVSKHAGVRAVQACDHGARPRCAFVLSDATRS
jgi:predicted ArsR family transcriptional regulator